MCIRDSVNGGEGSACPGLVPLTTLMRLRAGILCGALHNDDGMMIINVTLLNSSLDQQDSTFFCHLFFIGSKHVLFPTRDFDSDRLGEQQRLRREVQSCFDRVLQNSRSGKASHSSGAGSVALHARKKMQEVTA